MESGKIDLKKLNDDQLKAFAWDWRENLDYAEAQIHAARQEMILRAQQTNLENPKPN